MSEGKKWSDPVGAGTLVKWDVPKSIEGVFRGYVEVNGDYGLQKRFTLVGTDGTVMNFFAPTILERILLEDPRIVPGAEIQITSTGKSIATKRGKPAKEFEVRVAEPVSE